MVQHFGSDKGDGEWKCVKDAGSRLCAHINAARKLMRQVAVSEDSDGEQIEANDEDVGLDICMFYCNNCPWYKPDYRISIEGA